MGDRTADSPRLELHDPVHATLVVPGGSRGRVLVVSDAGPVRDPASGAVRVLLVVDGWQVPVHVDDAELAGLRERAGTRERVGLADRPAEVRAIIPGRVVAVAVTLGEAVAEGQAVVVLEAMKMQNEIRAPRSGTIARIAVEPGATAEAGDLLVEIE
jgi:acetyl/propionyl-CoA carboxylase alpha subunit